MICILNYLANYDLRFKREDKHFITKWILNTKLKSDYSANVLDFSFYQCLDDAYMQYLKPAIFTFEIQQNITNVKGGTKIAEDFFDLEVFNTDELMKIDQRAVVKMSLN